ncbi:MAG: hypothetical protein COU22_03255 [Candidatus Komeilibacteria bacterium CG10_big_fil_rev_8_21_14_0_10_41_13]|uniref:Phosphoesterase n=1 Tax=Candidatus Komeilibacteria bacterium CG10_big_fil_rev_8_21_14_0_10_41_13 TaxID=1974476 RepID=A0A2M6WBT8_9BACT|nr:MAG: hypothetical protein COU22_03255 [Candidatus Komeilibacteria bacterium CG10_big_fil_rev_8_21_14_0_10_41_13]
MKIAIISDTHDNVVNLEKAINYLNQEKITTIIHCGDVCSRAVLRHLAKNYQGMTYWVLGNVHAAKEEMVGTDREFNNLKYFEDFGLVEFEGKKIGFVHFPDEAKKMAQSGKYDLVFYGHTHKPWEETVGQTRLVNPGTLGGVFYNPTFALYNTETGELELKILDQLK